MFSVLLINYQSLHTATTKNGSIIIIFFGGGANSL